MKQKELSRLLRALAVLVAVFLLAMCVLVAPALGEEAELVFGLPGRAGIVQTVTIVFLCLTALPGFAALWLAWRIFGEIGRDNSFCRENALRLRSISLLALVDTVVYSCVAVSLAALDLLPPGVFLVLAAAILLGAVMTAACSVLSHLTRKAADLKADSELTI